MRILFVSPNLPNPNNSGGAQRTKLIMTQLQKMGTVDSVFLPTCHPPAEILRKNVENQGKIIIEASDAIRNYHSGFLLNKCYRGLQHYLLAERHKWIPYPPLIKKLGNIEHYDLVICRYLSSACILDAFRHPNLIIDVDDYDPDRLSMRLKHASALKSMTLKRCLKTSSAAHRELLQKAAHCWVSNPKDRKHKGLSEATILPNIPSITGDHQTCQLPHKKESMIFIMVATFSYNVNLDGAISFIKEAWPTINKQFPEATLRLIGNGIPPKIASRLATVNGVQVLGYIKDIRTEYARCLAAICPVRAGGGTNIKVLEAAAYNRPTILTPQGYRGFEATFQPDISCFLSNSVREMHHHCINLLKAPEKAAESGRRAAEVIAQHYTPHIFQQAVKLGCSQINPNTCRLKSA
jgi:glycosyltransferase involved in cell wall biosynthesis